MTEKSWNGISFYEYKFSDTLPGLAGLKILPEYQIILLRDSSTASEIKNSFSQSIVQLLEDYFQIEPEGEPITGSLIYTNDPENFKYDVFAVLKNKPSTADSLNHCKLDVLKSDTVVLFNHYGPYQNLFLSYNEIRKWMKENNFYQSGVMREVYRTNPTKVNDSTKWLTQIFVPVRPEKKSGKNINKQ
ncbi:MAG: GyrI-like domain-containing protein [Bacteroidia bacterium]|nr:GyrI-like domain-containing protein [Bacteroidia bacterium]